MTARNLILDAQTRMLRSSLNADLEAGRSQRKAITAALSDAFTEMVQHFSPAVIVEIGAHEAGFSRRVARQLPDVRVIAFEAHPDVFNQYADRVKQSGAEYVNACIADRPGKLTLRVPVRKTGERRSMGSLLTDGRASHFSEYSVDGITLDDFLGADAARPNVIWIDVEGAIAQVLTGAQRTLQHCNALYAEVESHPRWKGQITSDEVSEKLAAYGLKPVLRDIQRELDGKEWQFNVVYVHHKFL